MCSHDTSTCLEEPTLYQEICKQVGLFELNPDLEGEIFTLNDGVKGLISILVQPSSGRILSYLKDAKSEKKLPSLWSFFRKIIGMKKKQENLLGSLE
jgi:hypothetical protein